MSAWLLVAIETKNRRLSVALADSVPLVIEDDKLGLNTREMVAGDCTTIEGRN